MKGARNTDHLQELTHVAVRPIDGAVASIAAVAVEKAEAMS